MPRKPQATIVQRRVVRIQVSPSCRVISAAIAKANGTASPDQAGVQHRRMDHHQRVLQQGIQPCAVIRVEQTDRAAGHLDAAELEGIRHEQVHRREEQGRCHQHRRDVRHHRHDACSGSG